MLMAERLELMGAPGSPYTRKMIALLRYRHIDYAVRWGGHQNPPAGYPQPKVNLLPTVYFANGAGGLKAEVDSTPIIRRLEAEYRGRSVIPNNPLLAFLCYLLEDFGDEWMTKQMFHYRWAHQADAENAAPLLVYWSVPTLEEDAANQMAAMFAKRQIGRLYVVGSNEVTAETIESSYARLMHIFDTLFQKQGYVLGKRPSAADFAIYGQLTQLAIVEPTSAAVASRISPRVRAWLDRVEDLSGLDPESDDWVNLDEIGDTLSPLLTEIGRVYVPFLLANAAAAHAGAKSFETEIDGRAWTQPTFPYQAKCLEWIREQFVGLPADDQQAVRDLFETTDCSALLS
jgi:glutathione S-transferase